MSSWGLQVEASQPQTPYLVSLAVTRLLSPPFLPPSSLISLLHRVDSGWSACTLDTFPPLPHGTGPKTVASRATNLFSSPDCGVCS